MSADTPATDDRSYCVECGSVLPDGAHSDDCPNCRSDGDTPADRPESVAILEANWPTEHHKLCDSHADKDCDCYMRFWKPKRDALAALVSEFDSLRATHLRSIDRNLEQGNEIVRLRADNQRLTAELAEVREAWDARHDEFVSMTADLTTLREALEDLATHGTNHDCNPTVLIHANNEAWMESHTWWVGRAMSMDSSVRKRARAALDAVRDTQ